MSDPFQSMVDRVFTALGRAEQAFEAEFQHPDEVETTACLLILSYDLTQWGDRIQVQNNMAMISVRKSEIEARPRRGDFFTLATGRQYLVERVMVSDDYEHRVLVTEVPA